MKTISQEKVEELGKALADFHRNYTEQDMREVLNYALKNRQMDGYPHEIAAMLDSFAKELRKLPLFPMPMPMEEFCLVREPDRQQVLPVRKLLVTLRAHRPTP